jgi:hypothetical protein
VAEIQIIGEKEIRIGSRVLRMGRTDKPWPDGTWMCVEVSGKPYSDRQQRMRLSEFAGVTG